MILMILGLLNCGMAGWMLVDPVSIPMFALNLCVGLLCVTMSELI